MGGHRQHMTDGGIVGFNIGADEEAIITQLRNCTATFSCSRQAARSGRKSLSIHHHSTAPRNSLTRGPLSTPSASTVGHPHQP